MEGKMGMTRLLALMGLTVLVSGCEYSRKSGMFENYWKDEHKIAYDEATGYDLDPASGDTVDVKLINDASVFSASPSKDIKIYDFGILRVHGTTNPGNNGAYPDADAYLAEAPTGVRYNDFDLGFFGAYWFQSHLDLRYEFTYRHITNVAITSGLEKGGSKCDLQRMAAIIDDCRRAAYSTTTIIEMLVVTHHFRDDDTGEDLYAQTVLAIGDDGETYVTFIYEAPGGGQDLLDVHYFLRGYINGNYPSTASSSWGGLCDDINKSPTPHVHLKSNCLCNDWNDGVYMFHVKDYGGTFGTSLTHECTTTTIASSPCSVTNVARDWPFRTNRNCMPAVVPTDTCREHVSCQRLTSTSAKISITLLNPTFTEVALVPPGSLAFTQAVCSRTLVNNKATFTLNPNDDVCTSVSISGDDVTFHVYNHEKDYSGIYQPGYRVFEGTCHLDDLPQTVTSKYDVNDIYYLYDYDDGETVDFFVATEKIYDMASTKKIQAGDEVLVGLNLFPTICLDYGSGTFTANVDPYGVYVKDCYIGKDANFATKIQIINDGCRVNTGSPDERFYLEDSFKEAVGFSDNAYDFCISTGKMDAAKWIDDADSTIHIRCEIDTCWNKALYDDGDRISKCQDSCNGEDDDGLTRRKRDVQRVTGNSTTTLETSFTLKRPEEPEEAADENCVSNTIAIATLTTLLVLLLPMMGVVVMMFYKLHSRKM
ncbi:uncharacterized protein LOC128241363 [Mya arenaria]|uniref:uncharacterized protein LOC128241363 n=1 Tax=Mya arenaria TaxID=6604 RepID=UPI0022E84A19|nr:uncharacterized protein LOC128241363 [Mya arenaria]